MSAQAKFVGVMGLLQSAWLGIGRGCKGGKGIDVRPLAAMVCKEGIQKRVDRAGERAPKQSTSAGAVDGKNDWHTGAGWWLPVGGAAERRLQQLAYDDCRAGLPGARAPPAAQ